MRERMAVGERGKSEARGAGSRRLPSSANSGDKLTDDPGEPSEAPGACGTAVGAAAGHRAVHRADDAKRVIKAIERTHTRQVGKAAAKAEATKAAASKVRSASERALAEGRRSGGFEQLKGHFVEILDVDSYNAKNKLVGKRLEQLPKSTNEAYDALRFTKRTGSHGRSVEVFSGGVQQKASASHVEHTISAMERKKPGSARKGTLRVPRDQASAARRKAAGRVKEVKSMDFTRQEAADRLGDGVKDVARNGTKAASKVRALGKAGAIGAGVSTALGGLSEIPALRRGEVDGREYLENRVIDAAEGGTGAVAGTVAAGAGAAAGTAALGTAAGASFAASAGAAGTAAVGVVGSVGAPGAALAGALGGITAPVALPAAAGALLATGVGFCVTKGFKWVRGRVNAHQQIRRRMESAAEAAELTDVAGDLVIDGTVIELTLRGRWEFTESEAERIRALLREIEEGGGGGLVTARLRRLGFYVSDWTPPARRLTTDRFDELANTGLITVTAD